LLILLVLLALVFMAGVGYILNKKAVNLALVSIGVDYFQVLSMFARSKIVWPGFIKDLFNILSVFNFNIEITAPECSIPDLSFAFKWTFTMLIPVGIGLVYLLVWLAIFAWGACKGVDKRRRLAHTPPMVGMGLVTFYYLYLFLARGTFDIFNCLRTVPFDGYGPGYLQAEFMKCYESGGTHFSLVYGAIGTLLVYVLGFPLVLGLVLWRNKRLIKLDQILRAMDTGDDRVSNPKAYDFRRMMHKMYYFFKPGKWYWILVVIARKFGIAVVSLMFVRAPSFQFSMMMVVLFAAYALQVRHLPYMSMSERRAVILHHQAKVAEGVRMHVEIAAGYEQALARRDKRGTARTMDKILKNERHMVASYLTDYNTLEATLLFCAMIVCLIGIMFQTGSFDAYAFSGQRDALTVIVALVIIFSLLYFFFSLFMELAPTFCPRCLPKSRKSKKEDVDMGSGPGAGDMVINPMAMAASADGGQQASAALMKSILTGSLVPSPEHWLLVRSRATGLRETRKQLQRDVAKAQGVTDTVGRESLARSALPSGSAQSGLSAGGASNRKSVAGGSVWKAVTDPASGKTYYYNKISRETTWTKPRGLMGDDAVGDAAKATTAAGATAAALAARTSAGGATDTNGGGEWKAVVDPSSGNTYWYNKKTRETTWTDPTQATDGTSAPGSGDVGGSGGGGSDWEERTDEESGHKYYYSAKDRRSTWTPKQLAAVKTVRSSDGNGPAGGPHGDHYDDAVHDSQGHDS
jgi:hypothetical protein